MGEANPITLRNVANLQLILLEEAEGLQQSDARSIIGDVKYEMKKTLEAFMSLNSSWIYRLDVASLQTNLGFIAIWQGKPKTAKRWLRKVEEIELPPGHALTHRIIVLDERVDELEKYL